MAELTSDVEVLRGRLQESRQEDGKMRISLRQSQMMVAEHVGIEKDLKFQVGVLNIMKVCETYIALREKACESVRKSIVCGRYLSSQMCVLLRCNIWEFGSCTANFEMLCSVRDAVQLVGCDATFRDAVQYVRYTTCQKKCTL